MCVSNSAPFLPLALPPPAWPCCWTWTLPPTCSFLALPPPPSDSAPCPPWLRLCPLPASLFPSGSASSPPGHAPSPLPGSTSCLVPSPPLAPPPTGPATWVKLGHCNGTRQSPVELSTHDAVPDPRLGPVALSGYGDARRLRSLHNTGHTGRPFSQWWGWEACLDARVPLPGAGRVTPDAWEWVVPDAWVPLTAVSSPHPPQWKCSWRRG